MNRNSWLDYWVVIALVQLGGTDDVAWKVAGILSAVTRITDALHEDHGKKSISWEFLRYFTVLRGRYIPESSCRVGKFCCSLPHLVNYADRLADY
jgi:hypothetical protein